mmetsp:Transcript_21905/g.49998  ORF Transcript_21905/g.49998 Transcript_21905/m.49998 type:complete len:328 (+) Transcript_21905:57-1040(+)
MTIFRWVVHALALASWLPGVAGTSLCPAGQEPQGIDDCVACRANTSKAEAGNFACSPCARLMSSTVGATECFCRTGFYKSTHYTSGEVCSVCPVGGSCDVVGSEPSALPGYYRLDFEPDVAFALCPIPSTCLGSGVCAENHKGNDCSLCNDGYKLDGAECQETAEEETTAAAIVLPILVLCAAVLVILLVAYRQEAFCFATVGKNDGPEPEEMPLRKQFSSSILQESEQLPSQWPPLPPPQASRPQNLTPVPPPPPMEGEAPPGVRPYPQQVPPPPLPPPPSTNIGSRGRGQADFEPVLPAVGAVRGDAVEDLAPGMMQAEEEVRNF